MPVWRRSYRSKGTRPHCAGSEGAVSPPVNQSPGKEAWLLYKSFLLSAKKMIDSAAGFGTIAHCKAAQPRLISTVDDDIICTEKIIADRKTFFIDLKSNARGRVVRITEKVSSNRDRIMVPAEILDDFIAALEDIRRVNNEG